MRFSRRQALSGLAVIGTSITVRRLFHSPFSRRGSLPRMLRVGIWAPMFASDLAHRHLLALDKELHAQTRGEWGLLLEPLGGGSYANFIQGLRLGKWDLVLSTPRFRRSYSKLFAILNGLPFGLEGLGKQSWLLEPEIMATCNEIYRQHNLEAFFLGVTPGSSGHLVRQFELVMPHSLRAPWYNALGFKTATASEAPIASLNYHHNNLENLRPEHTGYLRVPGLCSGDVYELAAQAHVADQWSQDFKNLLRDLLIKESVVFHHELLKRERVALMTLQQSIRKMHEIPSTGPAREVTWRHLEAVASLYPVRRPLIASYQKAIA